MWYSNAPCQTTGSGIDGVVADGCFVERLLVLHPSLSQGDCTFVLPMSQLSRTCQSSAATERCDIAFLAEM